MRLESLAMNSFGSQGSPSEKNSLGLRLGKSTWKTGSYTSYSDCFRRGCQTKRRIGRPPSSFTKAFSPLYLGCKLLTVSSGMRIGNP